MAGLKLGSRGAISLTQEFPSRSVRIRTPAPIWQADIVVGFWVTAYYMLLFMCFGGKTCLLQNAKSYAFAMDNSLTLYNSQKPGVKQVSSAKTYEASSSIDQS